MKTALKTPTRKNPQFLASLTKLHTLRPFVQIIRTKLLIFNKQVRNLIFRTSVQFISERCFLLSAAR